MTAAAAHDEFVLVLPCDGFAPRKVRRELDKLDGIDEVRGMAHLVATEIVTNAVLHSGCTPEHQIEVHARVGHDELKISVHDPGLSDAAPQIRDRPTENDVRVGGLGLMVVDRVADRWGIDGPDGRVVWACLPL